MTRLGLCCVFKEQKIKFRTVTFANLSKPHISGSDPYNYLSDLILDNCKSLEMAIKYCAKAGIGSFRINSQFFPLATHPQVAYTVEKLPKGQQIADRLEACRRASQEYDVRLTLHPDQFILLNSPQQNVVNASIQELLYQDALATIVGADAIVIHGGGGYGDKIQALDRLRSNLNKLPTSLRNKLTLENDDKIFTPTDLLPLCEQEGIALTYDVHHHRCNCDEMTVSQATNAAVKTWDREPLFHISSPKNGWSNASTIRSHHDYIDIADFPFEWLAIDKLTVEVEAKAKELAVITLAEQLKAQRLIA